jgi:hypothetical protein
MSGNAVVSAVSGVATYSGVTFTGFIGRCYLLFSGNLDADSSIEFGVFKYHRVIIGSSLSLFTGICCDQIELGNIEEFSGIRNAFQIVFF